MGVAEFKDADIAVSFLYLVFVEDVEHLLEVHDYWKWFLGIFFFWVIILYNQIILSW